MAMGLLTIIAKGLADRPRPTTALISETSSSFPSGRALGIMVSVLAFLTILWPTLSPRRQLPAAILGAVIVFAVGVARVVLNVHHTTDVIAGWALGLGYYLLCVILSPPRPGISGSPNRVPQR
jgi:undecaprenyl-diphosphatase